MKKKHDEFPVRCAMPCSGWARTFAEGSLATDLVKCSLALWKKCVVAGNQVAMAAVHLAVEVLQAPATAVGTAAIAEATVIGGAGTIVAMHAGRAITEETTIGLETVDTGRVRAVIVVAVQVAVPQNLRRV